MKIVSVCACPTGVAHTYMAASRLEECAISRGHQIHIEKQGALGCEDQLKETDIQAADLVILVLMVGCEMIDRFEDKKIMKVNISEVVKNVDLVFDRAEKMFVSK